MCKIVIIMTFLASLIGLTVNPEILSAADEVDVKGIDNLGIVETVIPEPEPEPEPEVVQTTAYYTVSAPSAGVIEEVYYEPEGINIGGRTISIYDVASTTVDAGNHVNRFRKLLYGHNSWAVFGTLSDYGVGNTFTITEGGVTTTYIVREVAMFEKNQENGKLQVNGSGNYMNGIVNAWGHSVALMTCAGTPLGGGDATHRLVVFADAI